VTSARRHADTAFRDPAPVIELIAGRADTGGTWRVSSTEIRDALAVDPLDFYRRMYEAASAERSVLDLGDITGTWSEENPEVLLAALEVFCGARAEPRLANAGIFLPHESRLDIIETFLSTTASVLADHVYDAAEVSAMLRSLRGCERARTAYIRTHFPLAGLIDRAVEQYCGGKRFEIPTVARANVRRLIELFFRRHVLSEAALFAGLSHRIYRQAVEEGYEGREGHAAGAETAGGGEEETDALEAARRTLGVAGLPLSRRLLRERYRGLMKRFHPDVNPAGLERAKEINAAYSRLLAVLS
jgi:hypothetical protein